jgi:hypothetical protein
VPAGPPDRSAWRRRRALVSFCRTARLLGFWQPCEFQRSNETVITVFCLTDMQDTEAAAKTIIYRHPVHDVLIHELIHYLDAARNPVMHTKGTGEDQQGKTEYYNDPAEFNAFFTNLAHPLLVFLDAAHGEANVARLAQFAEAHGLRPDFKETLAVLIQHAQGQASPALKRYWAHLLPDRRKRVIRRLYALHKQVVTALGYTAGRQSDPPTGLTS